MPSGLGVWTLSRLFCSAIGRNSENFGFFSKKKSPKKTPLWSFAYEKGTGIPVFPGIALGIPFFLPSGGEGGISAAGSPESEKNRLAAALETVREQLSGLYEKAREELGKMISLSCSSSIQSGFHSREMKPS